VQRLDEGPGRIRSAACLPPAWQPLAGALFGGEQRALVELGGVALEGAVRIERHLVVYDLEDDVMKKPLDARQRSHRVFNAHLGKS